MQETQSVPGTAAGSHNPQDIQEHVDEVQIQLKGTIDSQIAAEHFIALGLIVDCLDSLHIPCS